MAGKGFAPSNPDVEIHVEADGKVRGPELPDIEGEWPDPTVTWWDNWRRSPQATTFTDTDWDVLLETALLHAAFWEGDTKVAGELRLRVAKFGATIEDRARLKMGVGEPPARKPSKRAAQRRAKLRVVGDD